MGISKETLNNELLHAAKLDGKQRGEIAELAFMRKAATLGFAVAKPWGDSDRYDVIVRTGKQLWRVQIKSVWWKSPARPHYRVKTTHRSTLSYTADDIDFLVAYIFPEDMWYVFPVELVENHTSLCIRVRSKRSRFNQYREAWELMRAPGPEPAVSEMTVPRSVEPAVEH